MQVGAGLRKEVSMRRALPRANEQGSTYRPQIVDTTCILGACVIGLDKFCESKNAVDAAYATKAIASRVDGLLASFKPRVRDAV